MRLFLPVTVFLVNGQRALVEQRSSILSPARISVTESLENRIRCLLAWRLML